MEINNHFKNELAGIKNVVDSMSPSNFIDSYYNFIGSFDMNKACKVEQKFFMLVNDSERGVIKKMLHDFYKDKSNDYLISKIVLSDLEDSSCYDSSNSDGYGYYFVSKYVSDLEFYKIMIDNMKSIICEIESEASLSYERKIISEASNLISSNKEELSELYERIEKLIESNKSAKKLIDDMSNS